MQTALSCTRLWICIVLGRPWFQLAIGCAHFLWSSIAGCTVGVRSQKHTSHFPSPRCSFTWKPHYRPLNIWMWTAVHLTLAVGSIHILWRPVALYTVGIRSRKPTSDFTTPWVHSPANRIIVHPLYGSIQLPIRGPLTSLIGSVQIKGISVEANAAGVRSRKCTSRFTTPCMEITHVQTALSCIRCTDMYSHSDADALHQPCALYTS